MMACLFLSRHAVGQVYSPDQGNVYTPNAVFNGSPAGWNDPNASYPAYAPPTMDDGILPVQGDAEPGALSNLSFSQPVGEFGTMSVYGSPNAESFGAGAAFSANTAAWLYLRDLQAAVYSNQEQTVVNAGSAFTLFSNDYIGVGGRALLGATIDDQLQDELHFSGDVFAGVRLPGEIWLKGGFLYDTQDHFYKYGPTFGAVVMADAKHPVTIDFAYGMGEGEMRPDQQREGILAIADDDVQLRVGTYLSPMVQLGLSGNWARWDDPRFRDDTGIGGFARVSIADLEVSVDVTEGDLGTRGFLNVAYVFGGPHRKDWRTAGNTFVDRPRDWLTRPVTRDASLRIQQFVASRVPQPPPPPPPPAAPLVGNLSQVACNVLLNPMFDQVNPGVLDPGDGFNLIVTLGNGTTATASNISITNIAADQPFVIFNSPQNEVIMAPNLTPGQTAQLTVPSVSLGINPSTPTGQAFNISFDVTSDGVTRRFQCGPIILGQSGNATPADNATPLN